MSSFPKPTEKQIREAFNDHRVDYRVHRKERSRDNWANGLRAATVHHTAGKNSTDYLATAWSLPGANVCVTNGKYNDSDGVAVILAWGSAFHSGDGGPWPGVAARNSLHLVSWGIEIESIGTRKDITGPQIETVGRMLGALVDLGMPMKNIHRHADWTDGTGPLNNGPLPTRGRKIDTRADLGYTTEFWKDSAHKFGKRATWDGMVPSRKNVEEHGPRALWRLQARLYDLGYRKNEPVRENPKFPRDSLIYFQKKNGISSDNWGKFNARTQRLLFGEEVE